MNTASGKNNGTYSTSLIHASFSASNAVGYPGNLSTNVTAKIIPHTINKTIPTPLKKRLNKNLERILLCAIFLFIIAVTQKSIDCLFPNCKIKMNIYNSLDKEIGSIKWIKNRYQNRVLKTLSMS